MICYVLAMGKQQLGPHVVVGYGIKIFWPGLFITSPDHLDMAAQKLLHTMQFFSCLSEIRSRRKLSLWASVVKQFSMR